MVEDPQRKPADRDRSALAARIGRAADQGRISAADRDIRLRNVASAQTMAELDLTARDLDQLEAAIAPGMAAPTPVAPDPPASGGAASGVRVEVNRRNIVIAVVAMAVVVLGLLGLLVFGSGGSGGASTNDDGLLRPVPPSAAVSDPVGTDSGSGSAATGSAYALTGPGIRWFLGEYRTRLGTTKVVDLTLYDDYAVVQVPQPGTSRHTGMLFRPADGWQDFGGITANFPGSAPVDLNQLDVPALVRNVARARSTLGVESVSQTYVVIDYRPDFDAAPNVDIHVGNAFAESGYLATTLDGTVERAFPYEP